ncbi:unnamed protein product [Haemonchus placei]|uniref:EF-hand domain-containing protein n=1 Tax=Haemonchus placei TaxID=6290 RepID=A0A0N4XBR2_HAEPC|nr:unnamed protein product [Haemonchus placei]
MEQNSKIIYKNGLVKVDSENVLAWGYLVVVLSTYLLGAYPVNIKFVCDLIFMKFLFNYFQRTNSFSLFSRERSRETALKWKFDQLNANNNQVLERSEWKPYKSLIVQWKKVKQCSRSFFKSCDTDANRKLTLEEWKKCFTPILRKTPPLRPDQLNPFLYILKGE